MKSNSTKTTRSASLAALAILAAFLSFTGCEDNLTDLIKEEARLAALPEYTLTILAPTYGSVTPLGKQKVKKGEPLSVSVSVPDGYAFVNWQIVSGAENVSIKEAESASTKVYALKGDATIQPVIGDAIYTLTVTNDGHGATDPESTASVSNKQPRTITATPAAGYGFDEWAQTAGPGTATFQNSKFASTTVTVTGGNVTIQARFKVGQYAITITNDGNGSTNVISQTLSSGVAGSTIIATPNAEYEFANWTVIAGSGITFLPSTTSASVTVTAISGDATIRANFVKKTYTLTIKNPATGGYASPSGNRTVTTGTPLSIYAYGYPTYTFDTTTGWTKTSGTGTVVFDNNKTANTTVTVTGGNATIQPAFRKFNVSLTAYGSTWTPGASDSAPQDFKAAAVIGNYLYYAGPQSTSTSNGVIRQIDISSLSPLTSGSSAQALFSSRINDMISVGTSLVIGTEANMYKILDPTTSMMTVAKTGTATPAFSLSPDPGDSNSYWAYIPADSDPVSQHSLITLSSYGDGLKDSEGYTFEKLIKLNNGLLSIQEDNGFRRLAGYYESSISRGIAPDSWKWLYDGGDMDEGEIGMPSLGLESMTLAIPVQNIDDVLRLRIFNVEEPDALSVIKDINLGDKTLIGKCATYDYTEGNDAYVYVSGSNGTQAVIWIVNVVDGFAATPITIAGYSDAPYVIERNGYLIVFLDALSTSATTRVAVKVYKINRS